MKIVFFGTPEYSLIVLDKLVSAGFTIVAVVTKPNRPVGRKQILTPTAVSEWAMKRKIPAITPNANLVKPWLFVNESKLTEQVLSFTPDVLISADYTQKIPESLINKIARGGINVHPSLLPAYRGPAPVPWAILNGETETGVSLVTLAEAFDAGDIIAQTQVSILNTDTTDTLLPKLFIKGAELLVKTLTQFANKPFKFINPTQTPSYFGRMNRDIGFEEVKNIIEATLGNDAVRIERKYRALHPWPGLWTKIKIEGTEKRLKLLQVHLKNGALELEEIQVEGKTAQKVNNILKKNLSLH